MNPDKAFRQNLGFSRQDDAKKFLAAKDVVPKLDFAYLADLNSRLEEIVRRLDAAVSEECRVKNIDAFIREQIEAPFIYLRDHEVLARMNNQGRRPEKVYFNWLRGNVFTEYFSPVLAQIFEVDVAAIERIGDDSLVDPQFFLRTGKADLEIKLSGKSVRIEVQAGFQGKNDIKRHKIEEARRVFGESGLETFVFHLDLFNGKAAMISLNEINDEDQFWEARSEFEGQVVFRVSDSAFTWRLSEGPPTLRAMIER